MFLLLVSGDAYTVERQTIEYENGDTGETLFCALCPPGTYVSSPCTRTEDTVCLPCPKEHFTQFWNFLPKCLYCSNICEGTRMVEKQCSSTHNRECKCKEGHYQQDHFCLPHTQCPPGMGAKTIGNTQMDTQCQKCPRGTFSAEKSSRAQCRNHTDCGTLQVLFPGRKWQDNICSPCANLTNGGGLEILRVVLPGIFFHQYVKLSKLERFVHSISGHNRRPVRRRALLLNFITKWIANASAHQLKTLPKHLQRVDLHSMAKKVQQMLKRIDKKVSTCQRLEEKTGRINGIFQE
ncbi:tumor necrosis factor receptor superfamily member 6B-like isoform X1 [Tachysurus fulvidraco]|uniref:tumor necrosis factor receptor superfamily member 6B-like isoform X1 n=1 Tax=Tachysurus fulvidraco TaxID=1234273 RepID=UPI001FEE5788|nr:tumor necrosis factor receptor superfamily member 6B-like isoform X1 [Tachysurus fulvidraco]